MKTLLIACALVLSACATQPAAVQAPAISPDTPDWRPVDAENLVLLELVTGTVTIELAPELAPKHVEGFKNAVRAGIYKDEFFYRVIENHVAQAGLEFDMRVAPYETLPLEADRTAPADGFVPLGNEDLFAPQAGHRSGFPVGRDGETEWGLHCPGALGMARDTAPDTGSIEVFIPLAPRRYLDRNYTIFGRVIDGMNHVHRLERVDPVAEDDLPAFINEDTRLEASIARAKRLNRNRIVDMRLAADLPAAFQPRWEVMNTNGQAWEDLKSSKRDYSEVDAFVVTPPQVVDICALPVPARAVYAGF